MISIKDIAKAVGVSPSAVSLVLNGKAKNGRISGELAARIVETSNKMGYFPNQVAVSLRTGKSKTIGLIVENISNDFFSSLAKTIEDEVRHFGYNVVYCSTENDSVKGGELIQMLYNQQVDGYLIIPVTGMEPFLEKLVLRKKPVVLMDRYLKAIDLPYVLVDNFEGMKKGMQLFAERGYKNIGYVTNDLDQVQMIEREEAYRAALIGKLPQEIENNILRVHFNLSKEESIKTITTFLQANRQLDAVAFATNYLCIDGLQSLKDAGLAIQKDIGVLCFDDHDVFSLHTPTITVIKQPVKDIAVSAVKILMSALGLIQHADQTQLRLPTEIVQRNSI